MNLGIANYVAWLRVSHKAVIKVAAGATVTPRFIWGSLLLSSLKWLLTALCSFWAVELRVCLVALKKYPSVSCHMVLAIAQLTT